jgi:hypothetical protein
MKQDALIKRFSPVLTVCLLLVTAVYPVAADDEEGWQKVQSRHFFIYYKDAPIDFVQDVNEAAESYYQEITQNLGFSRYEPWSYDDRARIYIYSDQDDYVNSAKQAKWSHGVANAREKIIRTFPSAHGFFDSTLPHELGHIIFREFVGFQAEVPLWMDEGVAMYQEKAKRWGSHVIVAQAMENDTFIPLPELSTMGLYRDTDRAIIDLFYAEAASAMYFLISEHGKHRFVSFCQELQEGIRFDEALRRSYSRFDSMEEFNKAWVQYIRKRTTK